MGLGLARVGIFASNFGGVAGFAAKVGVDVAGLGLAEPFFARSRKASTWSGSSAFN